MTHSPSYYRARLQLVADLIQSSDSKQAEKLNDTVLHRNGVLTNKSDAESILDENEEKYSDEPLSFYEITRFNTWFAMHPEKICGKEVITTSREFPITIQGTKEDIIKTIRNQKQTETELELEALAIKLELQLV